MSSTTVDSILLSSAKAPLILFLLYQLWLLVINPIFRWVVGWITWGVMWELSALALLDFSTIKCRRRSGGLLERNPERLNLEDWVLHNSCVGREDGFDELLYGIIVIIGLAFLVMLVSVVAGASSRYIRVLRVTHDRLESTMYALVDTILALSRIISAIAGWLLSLAELFVVPKPVELSQVVLDRKIHDRLVKEKKKLEGKVSDLKVQMVPLEQIAQWCKSSHANPDARKMKNQNDLLEKNQRELDELRRLFLSLQITNKNLTARIEVNRRSKVTELQNTIDSMESEILGLQATITALEARLCAENLVVVKGKNAILEKRIADMTQEYTCDMAKATLENEALQQEIAAAAKRAEEPISRCEQMEKLEEKLSGTEYDLGKAQEDAKLTAETVERLQQVLQSAQRNEVAFRAQLRAEVESRRAELQTRYDEEIRASLKKIAEAAEADLNARVQESVATQMIAARRESAEAAEAVINSRVEEQLAARVAEAMAENAAAAEAAINSRVDEQITARILEALAEKAEADAALAMLDFGDLEDEFQAAVGECMEMAKAREIEAAAVTTRATSAGPVSEEDTTMSDGAPVPAATTFSFGGPVAFICAAAPKPEPVVRGAPARKRVKGPESRLFAPERPFDLSGPTQTPAAPAPAPALTEPITPARAKSLWTLRPIRPRGERTVEAGVGAAGPSGSADPPGIPSDVAPAAVGGRRRASGRVAMPSASPSGGIPGLGQLPAHEIARARAREEAQARGRARAEAAAHAAFSAGKFNDSEELDIEKPHQGALEPDQSYFLEDSDVRWY